MSLGSENCLLLKVYIINVLLNKYKNCGVKNHIKRFFKFIIIFTLLNIKCLRKFPVRIIFQKSVFNISNLNFLQK